jgi:hypothetical protein
MPPTIYSTVYYVDFALCFEYFEQGLTYIVIDLNSNKLGGTVKWAKNTFSLET